MAEEVLAGITLDTEEYVTLLGKLIGESERLQNNPPDLIPQEDLACRHVLDFLRPFSTESGGPLTVEHVVYTEGRGNILLTYPGADSEKCISFVGSHLDVVPANPETWECPPFEMSRQGDRLYGRGTTDCLGHVALVSCLFASLARARPELKCSVRAVFIASEEAHGPGVGIDGLMEHGKLDALRPGPIIWVDCSDSQPCIGTATSIVWHLKAQGRLFHSGLPHKGINALEYASEAVAYLQRKFYEAFPALPEEKTYNFAVPSTMKPTQMSVPKGGINQLPPSCQISGDIRLTPFHSGQAVRDALTKWVEELNENPSLLPTRGPCSKYDLPDLGIKGKLVLEFADHSLTGIACKLDSPGYHALCKAVETIVGKVEPYSVCGSLPLVGEMQEQGFDIQLIGFGLSSTYHADNEYCLLSDMENAMKILCRCLVNYNATL